MNKISYFKAALSVTGGLITQHLGGYDAMLSLFAWLVMADFLLGCLGVTNAKGSTYSSQHMSSFVDTPHFYLKKWGSTTATLKQQYGTPDKFKKTWRKTVSRKKGLLVWRHATKAGVACHYIIKWLDGDKK